MSSPNSVIRKRRRLALFVSVLAGPGLLAGAARAQAQPTQLASAADSSNAVGEIVVTAEKRAERLQDVPAAVTAVTAADLQKRDIQTTEDLSRSVPSLNFTQLSPGQLSLSMRGLTNAYGLFSTVSYYVDETPFAMRQDAEAGTPAVDLFDAQRVEVLSGPQGALYGAASMGGAIRVVLNQPDPGHFSMHAEGGGSFLDGGGSGYAAKIALNLPVKPNLAVRLTATEQLYPGFAAAVHPISYYTPSPSDQVIAKNSNTSQVTSVRVAAAWMPDSSWTITPSLYLQESDNHGFNYSDQNRTTPYQYIRDFVDRNIDKVAVGNIEIKKELGFATALSSTSYSFMYQDSKNDYDAWAARHYAAAVHSTANVPDFPTLNYEPIPYTQYTEELRLTSPEEGWFNWLGGFYFNSLKEDERQLVYSPAYGAFYSNRVGLPNSGVIFDYHGPTLDTEYAGFADVTLKPAPWVQMSAGVRVYDLQQSASIYQSGLQAGPNVPTFTGSEKGVNPRFNIDFKPLKDISFYATASEGYRPGGANTSLVPQAGTVCTFLSLFNQSYQPDSVWNYEAGEKAQFLNRTLTLNSDIYELDWTNIQGSLGSSCGTFIANFGSVIIHGVESNLDWKVTPDLSLYGSIAANHEVFSALKPGVGPALGITTGERPLSTPDLKYTLGGEYTFRAMNVPGYARVDMQHVGSMHSGNYAVYNNTAYTTPGYDNVNLAFGIYHGATELQFYVKNLTNKIEVYQIGQSQTQTFAENTVGPPRTFGITLRYSMR